MFNQIMSRSAGLFKKKRSPCSLCSLSGNVNDFYLTCCIPNASSVASLTALLGKASREHIDSPNSALFMDIQQFDNRNFTASNLNNLKYIFSGVPHSH